MKEFYITNNRFKFIALLLFLMFLIFIIVIYVKADEVTRDPCSICAEKIGQEVNCYAGNNMQRVYLPNATIINKVVGE